MSNSYYSSAIQNTGNPNIVLPTQSAIAAFYSPGNYNISKTVNSSYSVQIAQNTNVNTAGLLPPNANVTTTSNVGLLLTTNNSLNSYRNVYGVTGTADIESLQYTEKVYQDSTKNTINDGVVNIGLTQL